MLVARELVFQRRMLEKGAVKADKFSNGFEQSTTKVVQIKRKFPLFLLAIYVRITFVGNN